MDNARPLLVPVGGRDGVARLAEWPKVDNGHGWLHVRNIGMGPAENIAIRLELRNASAAPTVQLDEMLTTIEPLAAGENGLVRQWQYADKAVEISDVHWIVVSYDDIFHRHFWTECRRIKEIDGWVSMKTTQIGKLPPRVRETDYYGKAEGR